MPAVTSLDRGVWTIARAWLIVPCGLRGTGVGCTALCPVSPHRVGPNSLGPGVTRGTVKRHYVDESR
jgi:hypothetical protein